jgi:4-amino-4-deoxychorismate lyase
MLAALLNGSPIDQPQQALSIEDRGLSYGDGLFETMLLRNGTIRFVGDHLARLHRGCDRLQIAQCPEESLLVDFDKLSRTSREGIVKLIVTRGSSVRGYRANEALAPTRIAILYPPPDSAPQVIALRWCTTRLARNARLAGIKHLNRLEQVLAQNEWRDPAIAEGLMLDTEGEVVSAIASNLFIVSDGVLSTPDLRFCGVRGVMRQQVLTMAQRLGIEVKECSLWGDDILSASEVFLTNAIRGLRTVTALDQHSWKVGSVTSRLTQALETEA